MPIDIAHYHGWRGRLHSPWWSCLALVRVALVQLFRRKLYWVVLALGLAQFLLFWSIIYGVTQMRELPREAQRNLLDRFGFAATPEQTQQSGYLLFMERQSVVVMILLALSGSVLVGADFRHRSLPFYLSRRIDRHHYIAGKLLAVAAVVSLLTVAPALALFIEYGLFTSSFAYWIDHWRVVAAMLWYGAILCSVLSVLLVTLAAYLERLAPIAITWSSLFVLLPPLGRGLHEATGNAAWRLIDPWRNMRNAARLGFSEFDSPAQHLRAWYALAVLAAACAVCLLLLYRRVRAVDITT